MKKKLDNAYYMWLQNARAALIHISTSVLKTKALMFAKKLGCSDFFLP